MGLRGSKEILSGIASIVTEDAALRTAHKLYSSSHFASSGGKFWMSLQKDIQRMTNVRYRGGNGEEGRRDEEGEAGGLERPQRLRPQKLVPGSNPQNLDTFFWLI
jgi:hypothetical protein